VEPVADLVGTVGPFRKISVSRLAPFPLTV
jgi:hypothetical protein